MPVRTARQPGLDLRRFVGGVVVRDQMHVRPIRHTRVDLFEKVQELARAVTLVAFADHRAGGNVERGEERRRAVTDIGVGSALGHTGGHGQDRLLAIQSCEHFWRRSIYQPRFSGFGAIARRVPRRGAADNFAHPSTWSW